MDAGQLVRRYIEFTVELPTIRDFVPRVLEQLVTEQATKRPRSEEELTAATRLRLGEVRAVLNGLGSAALARPLDPAQAVWELSHDFIARAVARYLGRRRRNLWRRSVFYAAPSLLAAALIVIAGSLTWSRLSQDRILSELADLGVTVAPVPANVSLPSAPRRGLLALAPPTAQLTNERFAKVAELLAKLPAVQGLAITSGIDRLEPVANLHELVLLDVYSASVTDLKPLKGASHLQQLDLRGTAVWDLEPLRSLTGLQQLSLGGTKVKNIEPLSGLTALSFLNILGDQGAESRAAQATNRSTRS